MQSLPVVQFTYKGCNKAQFYLEMIMKLFLEGLQYITVCYISFHIVLFDYLYYFTIILNTTIYIYNTISFNNFILNILLYYNAMQF